MPVIIPYDRSQPYVSEVAFGKRIIKINHSQSTIKIILDDASSMLYLLNGTAAEVYLRPTEIGGSLSAEAYKQLISKLDGPQND